MGGPGRIRTTVHGFAVLSTVEPRGGRLLLSQRGAGYNGRDSGDDQLSHASSPLGFQSRVISR